MNRLFCLMGKSATGKDSISHKLRRELKDLRTVTLYTTRPPRCGEHDGREYFFIDEARLAEFAAAGKVIEQRAYETVAGTWQYATIDDGRIDLAQHSYLLIGTLESYARLQEYFGRERVVPLYIEVDDGVRLLRAVRREMKQDEPKYREVCRRFLADSEDFSEARLQELGIGRRFENRNIKQCVEALIEEIKNGEF